MRHFYTRLTLGIVFLVCLVFSIITLNIPFALLYIFLSAAMLLSAYSLWKKKGDDQDGSSQGKYARDGNSRSSEYSEKDIPDRDSRR